MTRLDCLARIVHDIGSGKTKRTKEWVYKELAHVHRDLVLDRLHERITSPQADVILRSTKKMADELEGKRPRGKP